MKVATGDNVKVHYRGTLTDGTEFDNSHTRGEPLEFTIGSGQMIVGFNDAIIGMEEGEKKTFSLTPELMKLFNLCLVLLLEMISNLKLAEWFRGTVLVEHL